MNFKLRYFSTSDFADYQVLMNNEKLAQLAGMQVLKTELEQWLAFKGMVGSPNFLAIANAKDRLCGGIFIFQQAEENVFELGYLLAEEYWNQGIMSRAVHFALKSLKERQPATAQSVKIRANVLTDNRASQRVLEKNGFTRQPGVFENVSGYDGRVRKEYLYELNLMLA
ncbi:GNAT family N-acetyltransferase [Pediococcus acidilactici]|nr:GNAT family N-acetyltransferase [Pediococcus acidilactici]UWF33376.1 GNAT family N-acetyltransferase [Pediococcus acidilactici]